MRTARRIAVGVLALALVGCGSESSALDKTDDNMAKLQAATMDLRLASYAGSGESTTGPVGFRLHGPFSLEGGDDFAVFDLDYTRLLGSDSSELSVMSTGKAVFVDTGAKTYRVPAKDAASLRVEDDPSGGFGDLGIAGWVNDPVTREGRTTDRITGEVNAPDLLSDLARLAGPLSGDDELTALSGDAADRLQKLVKSSSIEVITGAKDHQLRSLHAVINFGTRAPNDLRRTLGKYARARLDVRLSMDPLTKPLRVAAPTKYVEL